ncbi:MAG: class I SAM-dependent methyltransferase [Pseudonocardiales bacterium]|nr:class I SAM-dependent methyltransferase [Pseudonocardiales bacterium]
MTYTPLFGDYADAYTQAPYLDFTESVADALPGIWSSYRIQPESLLDYGCGNGLMLARLAPLLTRAIAVDSSPQMLKYTQQMLAKTSMTVEIVEEDMRTFRADPPVEVATCIYNTVNYLTCDEDIQVFFENVWHSLTEDGVFIFDTHPVWYITQKWRGSTFVEIDTEDTFECWQNPYDEQTGIVSTTVTLFRKTDNGWSRIREVHPARGLDPEIVAPILKNSGFAEVASYGDLDLSPVTKQSERLWFIARKN